MRCIRCLRRKTSASKPCTEAAHEHREPGPLGASPPRAAFRLLARPGPHLALPYRGTRTMPLAQKQQSLYM